jgi:hypothetical protein
VEPDQQALPTDGNVAAGEQAQNTQAAADTSTEGAQQAEGQDAKPEGTDQEGDKPEGGKKEKDEKDREIARLRRRIDNVTKRRYELEAQLGQQRPSQQPGGRQEPNPSDDEPVTLSRADIDRMVAERARELAPAITEQQAEIERRQGVVQKLEKSWGKDEFNAKAAELDEVMGGLMENGRPKAATDAIFDADDPKAVIEYLTDPDNADEAERIARLPATRAGREIARIEAKLEQARKEAKPKPSNAARPIEAVKGGGAPNGMPDPKDALAWIAWRNRQVASR